MLLKWSTKDLLKRPGSNHFPILNGNDKKEVKLQFFGKNLLEFNELKTHQYLFFFWKTLPPNL